MGTSKLDNESEVEAVGGGSTKDNDVTIGTSSPSSGVVASRQQHQEKSVSSDRSSPSAHVQAQKTG